MVGFLELARFGESKLEENNSKAPRAAIIPTSIQWNAGLALLCLHNSCCLLFAQGSWSEQRRVHLIPKSRHLSRLSGHSARQLLGRGDEWGRKWLRLPRRDKDDLCWPSCLCSSFSMSTFITSTMLPIVIGSSVLEAGDTQNPITDLRIGTPNFCSENSIFL